MSITLMSEVWPLEMPPSDKLVLLALADAANDEEGHTWIPVVSKVRLNRAGRPKLNLCVKTSLAKRTVQMAIARLVAAGHITREENPGVGVNYWVHPCAEGLPEERGAADAPVQEMPGAADSPTGASPAGEGRTSCAQTLNNHQEPSAGAPARAERAERPPAGPSGGPAAAARHGVKLEPVREKADERERELSVRGALEAEFGATDWLHRLGIRAARLDYDGRQIGLTLFAPPAMRTPVEAARNRIAAIAAEALGARINWFHVMDGRLG